MTTTEIQQKFNTILTLHAEILGEVKKHPEVLSHDKVNLDNQMLDYGDKLDEILAFIEWELGD